MRLQSIREEVCSTNKQLALTGLTSHIWGNASGIDRRTGIMVIKPSAIPFEFLEPENMILVSMATQEVIEGVGAPATDAPTHLALYRHFENLGCIIHTHSTYATAYAQAGNPIPCLGTTHADSFYGEIPVTRPLTEEEFLGDYEAHVGETIADLIRNFKPSPDHIHAALVAHHGPYCWGETAQQALTTAITLEKAAHLAWCSQLLNPNIRPLSPKLIEKRHQIKFSPPANGTNKPTR